VLGIGGSVVLDFGCWAEAERWAVRAVAEHAGGRFRLHFVDLPEAERRALRLAGRGTRAPPSRYPRATTIVSRAPSRPPRKQRSLPNTCLRRPRVIGHDWRGLPTGGRAFPTSLTSRSRSHSSSPRTTFDSPVFPIPSAAGPRRSAGITSHLR
jgi:hypothetical protein